MRCGSVGVLHKGKLRDLPAAGPELDFSGPMVSVRGGYMRSRCNCRRSRYDVR